jgi:hypothetical protein
MVPFFFWRKHKSFASRCIHRRDKVMYNCTSPRGQPYELGDARRMDATPTALAITHKRASALITLSRLVTIFVVPKNCCSEVGHCNDLWSTTWSTILSHYTYRSNKTMYYGSTSREKIHMLLVVYDFQISSLNIFILTILVVKFWEVWYYQ